jgi:hypothetical protein
MTEKTLREAVKILASAGISFYWKKGYELEPSWVHYAAVDREALWCLIHGINGKDLYKFTNHDWQCRHVSKQGHRCKNSVHAVGTKITSDGDEEFGIDPYEGFDPKGPAETLCKYHGGAAD